MDSNQVSLRTLGITALLFLLLAGCGHQSAQHGRLGKAVKKELGVGDAKNPGSTIVVQGKDSHFSVDDENGLPLLDAHCGNVEGTVAGSNGIEGPVLLHNMKALLYQKGKKSLTFESPDATWNEKARTLSTDKSMHGVTRDNPDRPTIIDGQKAVWTAANNVKPGKPGAKPARLELQDARLQQMKQGEHEFTTEGPHATVVGDVTDMDRGARGWNPEGKELTARHVRWDKATSKLDADGHVVVIDSGTGPAKKPAGKASAADAGPASAAPPPADGSALGRTILKGDVLHGNTRLNNGKLFGHTQVITTSARHSGPAKHPGPAKPAGRETHPGV